MSSGKRKMNQKEIKEYYLQDDLIDIILEVSKYREVAPTYPESYGKRPDALNFPGDFTHLVKKGAIAFHGSVEVWKNPLLIDSVNNLDNLRTGWDLVIDIDCDESFQNAKYAAKALIDALKKHGCSPDVKFSGNRGFHIGVSRRAFPDKVQGKEIPLWYPQLPQTIVRYLKSFIKSELEEKIGERPYENLDVESNWGDRHLFRLPYSLNEKSWLVSLPIDHNDIENFEKKDASHDKIKINESFLMGEPGDAGDLLGEALDFASEIESKKKKRRKSTDREYKAPERALSKDTFPPCIHYILNGLDDGRKRALFILLNFLKNTGYGWDSIEDIVWDWNARNKEELREGYVESQLNWHKGQNESIAPPNCDSDGYYTDIPIPDSERAGAKICDPDDLCKKINNPLSYAFRRLKASKNSEEGESEEDSSSSKGGIYECPYCGKRYKMKSYYKKHVQECFG